MLSPRARKALTLIATVIAAFLLSIISLAYLLYMSPNAIAARLERSADNHLYVAREIISTMSSIAEIENRPASLKKASEYQKGEGEKAYEEAKAAIDAYQSLIKNADLSNTTRQRANRKIQSSQHLLKAAKNYVNWLSEARKGTNIIKYTYQSFDWQSKGLKELNQAISEVNAGNNKKALQMSKEIKAKFSKAKEAILKAQANLRNRDIAQLNLMVDYYLQAANSLEKMAKASKDDTDTYNQEVDKLNKATNETSKIAAKSPVAKDLNIWLERNFYYEGGELIFHYKKAVEIWPE